MQKITTSDGSISYFNPAVGDYYHSKSGAAEEAIEKYAEPTMIAKLAKSGNIAILDICFGLGYNTAAAIDTALAANPKCKIRIMGLENDTNILDKITSIETPFSNYNIISILAQNRKYLSDNINGELLIGDARQKIKKIAENFDAVFFDPFSPSKQPDMWSSEFMRNIHKVMKKGAILATYSCARMVRDNLKKAGFTVTDGPLVGRRSPSTLAVK